MDADKKMVTLTDEGGHDVTFATGDTKVSLNGEASKIESFTIGDETIRNPSIRFTNLEVMGSETGTRLATRRELREMLLGLDFLRAHRVFVAHSQRKLYFTYTGGRVFAAPPPPSEKPAAKPDV